MQYSPDASAIFVHTLFDSLQLSNYKTKADYVNFSISFTLFCHDRSYKKLGLSNQSSNFLCHN